MKAVQSSLAYVLLAFLAGFGPRAAAARNLDVLSLDRGLQVTFTLDDGVPYYRVRRFGDDVIKRSKMGVVLKEAPAPCLTFAAGTPIRIPSGP